ncbi:hypothetical protein GX51_03932 [Blastomyces parvus]|uniref:Uncharacterized protein n=1 Tax=Blastomyces parvus TaxID=2060905 RepID=A0A2B7X4S2_9EURO|nr:hypothetical protein GX51_03932 [Blastomyces parvus]
MLSSPSVKELYTTMLSSPSVKELNRKIADNGLPVPPNSGDSTPDSLQDVRETRDCGAHLMRDYYLKRLYQDKIRIPGILSLANDYLLQTKDYFRYDVAKDATSFELDSSVFKVDKSRPGVDEPISIPMCWDQNTTRIVPKSFFVSKCIYRVDTIWILQANGTELYSSYAMQMWNLLHYAPFHFIDYNPSNPEFVYPPRSIVITDIPQSESRKLFRKAEYHAQHIIDDRPATPVSCFTPESKDVFYALLGTEFMQPIICFMQEKLIRHNCDGIETVEIATSSFDGRARTDIRVTFRYGCPVPTPQTHRLTRWLRKLMGISTERSGSYFFGQWISRVKGWINCLNWGSHSTFK